MGPPSGAEKFRQPEKDFFDHPERTVRPSHSAATKLCANLRLFLRRNQSGHRDLSRMFQKPGDRHEKKRKGHFGWYATEACGNRDN
jgi:hypothetical protein